MKEGLKITNLEDDVVFNGVLKFKDNLLIKGHVEGVVEGKDSDITIEEGGCFEGKIIASKIDNYGIIKGKAEILDEYNLYSTGKTDAEVIVKHIMIEKGAVFNGTCSMEK